jgi:hypothetical protein
MALNYKNPTSSEIKSTPESVTRTSTIGTNFSVSQVGGYMEVYTLSDLELTLTGGTGGNEIKYSGNTIPIRFIPGGTVPFPPFNLPNTVVLYSDNISSGRRRLGMLVYVHETQKTYQFTIPDYDTLWDNAVASGDVEINSNQTDIQNSTPSGQVLLDAWTGSTIEGVNGVTRENARWRIFWGTDWQVTGGTVDYNSTGDLNLDSNSGNTVTISGLKTITGGTYLSATTTLELYNNLGETIEISGFTSGSGDIAVSANTGLGIIEPNILYTIYNTALSPSLEMDATVGGIEAGTTVSDLTGKTFVDMFNDLLFPTVLPSYTQPTITLNGLSDTTKEIGSTESINVTGYGVKNDAGDYQNIRIRTGTTSANVEVIIDNNPSETSVTNVPNQFGFPNPNNPNSGFTSIALSYTLTVPEPNISSTVSNVRYDTIGDYDSGLVIKDNKGDDTTTSPISSGTNNSTDRIITGIYPYFWGISSTEPTASSIADEISGGTANKVLLQANGTITITFNATEEYLWFAHLGNYTTKSTWYVAEGNEGNIGSGSDLFGAVTTTSVDSPETYWTGINYKIYISNYPTTTAGGMQLRN